MAAALDKFSGEKRRLVISLNSPGGSITHGEEVMAAIRDSARKHPIDTLIKDGGVCASMCVSIFLLGAKRMAGPDAQFMFHEATINVAAVKAARGDPPSLDPALRKKLEKTATDVLFDSYGRMPRIDRQWLKTMRAQITERDVWISGQKLANEGSGFIDALVTKID